MNFNIYEELNPLLEKLSLDDKVKLDYYISDEFPKEIIGDIQTIKDIINYSLDYIKSNMVKGTVKLDLNCMFYDEAIGLYLSIMTRDTRIKKEDLDLTELSVLIDKLDGNLLVDNSDKGIILMIDFAMKSITNENV